MYHTAMHCRHWTPNGVDVAAVPNIFAPDAIVWVAKSRLIKLAQERASGGVAVALYGCFTTNN